MAGATVSSDLQEKELRPKKRIAILIIDRFDFYQK
jgi:hypothetical protein